MLGKFLINTRLILERLLLKHSKKKLKDNIYEIWKTTYLSNIRSSCVPSREHKELERAKKYKNKLLPLRLYK